MASPRLSRQATGSRSGSDCARCGGPARGRTRLISASSAASFPSRAHVAPARRFAPPPGSPRACFSGESLPVCITMSTKEIVSDLLERLPDDISLQEVAREIEFIAGVREGFESYEREGGVSIEDARACVSSWAKAATK